MRAAILFVIPLSILLVSPVGPSRAGAAAGAGAAGAGAARAAGAGPGGELSRADRLLGATVGGGGAYALLRELTDEVGARLAGSAGDRRAVAWGLAAMRRAGLSAVRAERVMVPRWDRGRGEAGQILGVEQPLHLVALGGSIGTPAQGITADVIDVTSFAEFAALPRSQVAGRIVLWNVEMGRTPDGMASYRDAAPYRGKGANEAAKKGAVASLVRSVGIASYRLPHTGAMHFDAGVAPIPAAAISAEDADLVRRLREAGPRPVRVRLTLPCRTLPEVESANVIGEVPGAERPDEIVLLGAHLDSWDLGTGAIDDGAGVAMVLQAAAAMTRIGAPPRRTVRVVLFANEENGLRGAKGYAQVHGAELPRHVAALEADSGAGRPSGFRVRAPEGVPLLRTLIAPLRGLNMAQVAVGDAGGSDLTPLEDVVPIFHLIQDTSRYFEWHHSAADTLDKVDPVDLSLGAAAIAVMAYGLADAPQQLPRPVPRPDKAAAR